jgi:hypothetical protein
MADWINDDVKSKEGKETEAERKLYKRILKTISRENGMEAAIKLMEKTSNFTMFLDEVVKIQKDMRKYRIEHLYKGLKKWIDQ